MSTGTLLSPKQLARRLNVSQAVIYVWASRGVIPFYDLGAEGKRGCIRFNEVEVEKWLKERHRPGK